MILGKTNHLVHPGKIQGKTPKNEEKVSDLIIFLN